MLKAVCNVGDFPRGVFFTLAAAVLWGSMAVAAQLLMLREAIDAAWLVVVRLCFAGGLLLLWALARQSEDVRRIFTSAVNFRDVLFGGFFIYGGQFAFMQAIRYSNAGAAAVVLTTVPLWVALWEALVNRRMPSARMMICFVLAASGVALIVTKGELDASQFNLRGLLWAVGCALMTAAYSVQPRALLKRVALIPVMGCAMLFGGIMAAAVALFTGERFTGEGLDLQAAMLLFHVVFFGTLVAFCCYMTAIRLISPVIVGILGGAEPVTAYVLSVLIMNVRVGAVELAGIVLVLLTVVILARRPPEKSSGENIARRWQKNRTEST